MSTTAPEAMDQTTQEMAQIISENPSSAIIPQVAKFVTTWLKLTPNQITHVTKTIEKGRYKGKKREVLTTAFQIESWRVIEQLAIGPLLGLSEYTYAYDHSEPVINHRIRCCGQVEEIVLGVLVPLQKMRQAMREVYSTEKRQTGIEVCKTELGNLLQEVKSSPRLIMHKIEDEIQRQHISVDSIQIGQFGAGRKH